MDNGKDFVDAKKAHRQRKGLRDHILGIWKSLVGLQQRTRSYDEVGIFLKYFAILL